MILHGGNLMDVRHSIHPDHARVLDTEDLRANFLIEKIFVPGEMTLTYSHVDRIIIGGVCPEKEPLRFGEELASQVGTTYLLERRELGLINLGGPGKVVADGSTYTLEHREALYLGAGTRDVSFHRVEND